MDEDLRPFRERYGGPWTIEENLGDHYVIRSAGGTRLAYVHYRDLPPEWRMQHFYPLAPAEALALARAIARLGSKKARRRAGHSAQLELPLNDSSK
jgi:hypothetical protein